MAPTSLDTSNLALRTRRWVSDWVRFWWYKVPEPRWISLVVTLIYTAVFLTGYATLVYPPRSIVGVGGDLAMSLVGVFFMVGSVAAMIAGSRDFWQLERWGIALMMFGVAVYGGIVLSLQVTESGSRLTQLGIIIACLLFFFVRMLMVWRYPYKPRS